MLETIVVVLLLLWLLGAFGGVISIGPIAHALLVVALVIVVIRLLQGRSV